jgi:O-antigen/teichoic acid export membrane protein
MLSVAAYVLVQLDIIFVKSILGNESAGYYKIASIFYFSFTIIPGSMMGVILPLLSKYKDSVEKFAAVQNNVYKFLALLSIVIVYTVATFVQPFLELLFSGKYNASVPVIMVLVWTIVPYYLEYISGYSLIAIGHEKDLLHINLVSILVAVIANLLFINLFGIQGAALATLIAISTKWSLDLLRLNHHKKMFKKNLNIYLFLIFSLINFLVYQQLEMNILIRYFCVLITLLLVVKLTGLINKDDIYRLKQIFITNKTNG